MCKQILLIRIIQLIWILIKSLLGTYLIKYRKNFWVSIVIDTIINIIILQNKFKSKYEHINV